MSSRSSRIRLVRNAAANWILFLFTALVGFFLSPFVVRHLGATNYGVWTLLAGMIGYLGLLDLGMRQAVSRYVAHYRARSEHDGSSSVVSAAVRLLGWLGIVALLSSGLLAYFTPQFFNIPPSLIDDARIILLLGGLTAAVSLIGGIFGGAVTGLERFDVQCGLEVFVTTVRAVAIVVALLAGYGLLALACILLAISILNCFAFWIAAHKLYPELRLRFRGDLLPHIRMLLSFGASLSVVGIFTALTLQSDALVIGAFLPIEAVTFFAIAWSLCLYAREVTRALSYVMTPRVSALMSIGSKGLEHEVLAVARMASLVAAPIAITFMLRGESFISLWMGPQFGPASAEVLGILAVVVLLDAPRSVVVQSLTGMGRQGVLIPGVAVEAACKVALSVMLARPLGITGVALGTLVPSVLMNLSYIPHCLSKATGVRVGHFCWVVIVLPMLACVPFAAASVMMERLVPAASLALFFAQVVAILPLVAVTAWFLCLTEAEKRQIETGLRKVLVR